MSDSRIIARLICVALLLLTPVTVFATEIGFSVTGDRERLTDRLKNASLVVEAVREEEATAQDILAAARADYLRMVEVLYDEGHYGGVVSIRIDGREVADISPLAGPLEVGRVIVRIRPGPAFWFSQADIGPLVNNTRPVEGYARGQMAKAGVIRDAARDAVRTWREVGHAKAEVTDQDITANHAKNEVFSDISVDPGPRLRFGQLTVTEGESRVRPGRVRAIAGLPTGEFFSPEAL